MREVFGQTRIDPKALQKAKRCVVSYIYNTWETEERWKSDAPLEGIRTSRGPVAERTTGAVAITVSTVAP